MGIGTGDARVQILATDHCAPTRQVLIDRLNFGLNDQAGRIILSRDPKLADADGLDDGLVDLQSGTVPADAVTVTVVLERADDTADGPAAATDRPSPGEPADPDAATDEPSADEPEVDSPPPAAQEIRFAEDLDDVAELMDEPEPTMAISAKDDSDDADVVADELPTFAEAVADESAEQPASGEPAVVPVEPTASEGTTADDASSGAAPTVMVLGIACPQGHHNHPDALYCSQCGTKMGVHHTTVLLNGPRPPHWCTDRRRRHDVLDHLRFGHRPRAIGSLRCCVGRGAVDGPQRPDRCRCLDVTPGSCSKTGRSLSLTCTHRTEPG